MQAKRPKSDRDSIRLHAVAAVRSIGCMQKTQDRAAKSAKFRHKNPLYATTRYSFLPVQAARTFLKTDLAQAFRWGFFFVRSS